MVGLGHQLDHIREAPNRSNVLFVQASVVDKTRRRRPLLASFLHWPVVEYTYAYPVDGYFRMFHLSLVAEELT